MPAEPVNSDGLATVAQARTKKEEHMKSDVESPLSKPDRRKPDVEQRIRQLIRRHKAERRLALEQNDELREEAAYMQRVVAQMIALLPKSVVSQILDAAKEFSQPTKGEIHVSSQEQYRHHQNQPGPEKGTGTAGGQGTLCRYAQAGTQSLPYRQPVQGCC